MNLMHTAEKPQIKGIIAGPGPRRHEWPGPPGPMKHDGTLSEAQLAQQEKAAKALPPLQKAGSDYRGTSQKKIHGHAEGAD
jgi:hypothetical protein